MEDYWRLLEITEITEITGASQKNITHMDTIQLNRNQCTQCTGSLVRYLYGRVERKEVEHALHVDEGLSNITVDRPKKIQGHGQLKQEAIHHHQITHRHGA